MNKAAEILILQETAKRLGPQSYLGPWLDSVIWEAQSLMTSDIRPEIRIRDTIKTCERQIQDADVYAKRAVEKARAEADKLLADARQNSEWCRARLRRQLEEAAKSLTL